MRSTASSGTRATPSASWRAPPWPCELAMKPLESKLPNVGTTIFTVMSRLAEQTGALNLGQGFPDFEPPPAFGESLARHVRAGKNQYAPMAGVPRLKQRIAEKLARDYGAVLDAE